MRILNLTVTRQWFDMILSGEKKEEYREVKPYWEKRFKPTYMLNHPLKPQSSIYPFYSMHYIGGFDAVKFTNGYSKTSPTFTIECKGIEIREGNTEWGAKKGTEYFVIKLGSVISYDNVFFSHLNKPTP